MGDTLELCGYLLVVLTLVCIHLQGVNTLVIQSPEGAKLEEKVSDSDKPDPAHRVETFEVNETGPHHFRTVLRDGDSLIVGARNAVFNISLITLAENKRIRWKSSQRQEADCKMQQRTTEECQNYIRLLAHKSSKDLLVCGTNAYNPSCRTYHDGMESFVTGKDVESGIGKVPYNPFHNNTALYADGKLFAGTVSDPQGSDPIIYSESSSDLGVRTEPRDSTWLNDPNFVSSFEQEDKVYFIFRETALEHINCGKAVFSRVARVCKNDKGGERVLRKTWTSFFKARLNCSIPGEFPFYFDEVQAATELGEGNYRPSLLESSRHKMFYAVFNTPQNGLPGSAVCAFRVQDILESFEGQFKEQKTPQSIWLPVKDVNTPTPHPARTCSNNSRALSDQTLNFIKKHSLMDKAVPAFGGAPIITQASFDYRMTQIVVDWQIKASDDRYYDVLFIGTDDGRIIKSLNKGHGDGIEQVTIEHVQVFTDKAPIIKLEIFRKDSVSKLVVIGSDQIKAIPLARCHTKKTCGECVGLQDPYCSWNINTASCEFSTAGIQSVDIGRHSLCKAEDKTPNNGISESPTTSPTPKVVATVTPCEPCLCPSGRPGGEATSPSSLTTDRRLNADRGVSPELENSIPPVQTGPCVAASNSQCSDSHSPAMMALAIVLSALIALGLGVFIGLLASSKYHARRQPAINSGLTERNSSAKVPNYYSEPDVPYLTSEKQQKNFRQPIPEKNFVSNQLKENKGNLPNGSVDSKLATTSNKVYL